MRKTLLFVCSLAIAALLILTALELPFASRLRPIALAQQFKTQPLYRYQSRKGHYLYTTDAKLPSGLSDRPWENEGIVCHVPIAAPHGTMPVYQLSKSDDLGVRYAFTSNFNEATTAAGWTNSGIVFYVANTRLPGTVPLYRLYKPVIPEKKKDTGFFAKLEELVSGPEFTASTAGVLQDTTFYTTQENEKATALQGGFTSQGILGYVWLSAQPPVAKAQADLVLREVKAGPSTVTAILFNQGQANTGGAKYNVVLVIYDERGKAVQSTLEQAAPGLSPNQGAPIKFQVGGVLSNSLRGKRYQLKIDTNDAVAESDEGNNQTAMLMGPAAIDQEAPAVAMPDLLITNRQEAGERTTYKLTVVNWDKYPAANFQQIDALPPASCSGRMTKARMLLHISAEADGKILANRCVALAAPQELRSLDITIPSGRIAPTKLFVIIEDRLLGAQKKSPPQLTGLFGLSLPCKSFLGRQDEIMCQSQSSFEACENLKKNGVPVKCGLTGKSAPK